MDMTRSLARQCIAWLACAAALVAPASAEDGPMIIRVKGDLVYLDAGRGAGIGEGDVYDILSPDIIAHPLTGDTLAVTPNRVGSVRVHQVFDKLSVGLLLQLNDGVDPMLMQLGRVTDAVRLQEVEAMASRQLRVTPASSGLSQAFGLVPGLYQIKSEERVKGWALLGASSAALALGVAYRISSDDWLDQYERLPQNTDPSVFDSYFNEATDRRRSSNRFFWLAGAVYAYNWIDILWSRSRGAPLAGPGTRLDVGVLDAGGPAVTLRHRFW